MASHNQLPAPVRYLRARLRALKRPMAWGPATVLALIGLFTWEYWFHPELFRATNDIGTVGSTRFNPSVSSEDSAIGADIDSLAVLLQDLNANNAAPGEGEQAEAQAAAPAPGLFDWFAQRQAETESTSAKNTNTASPPAAAPSNAQQPDQSLAANGNPFALYAQNYRLPGANSPTTSSRGLVPNSEGVFLAPPGSAPAYSSGYSTNLFNPSYLLPGNSANPVPANPLQAALERNATPTNAATAPATAESGTETGTGQTVPFTASPIPGQPTGTYGGGINYNGTTVPSSASSTPTGNAFDYLRNSQPPAQPITPAAPVAPPVAPITPNTNFAQPSFSTPNQGTGFNGGLNNQGGFSNSGVGQPQQTQPSEPRPFTVRRRGIGGGEINSFSNP